MKSEIEIISYNHVAYCFSTDLMKFRMVWDYTRRSERKKNLERLRSIFKASACAVAKDDWQQLRKIVAAAEEKFPKKNWSTLIALALSEKAYRCTLGLIEIGLSVDTTQCSDYNPKTGVEIVLAPPVVLLASNFRSETDANKRAEIIQIVALLRRRGADMTRIVTYTLNGQPQVKTPQDELDEVGLWQPVQAVLDNEVVCEVVNVTEGFREKQRRL